MHLSDLAHRWPWGTCLDTAWHTIQGTPHDVVACCCLTVHYWPITRVGHHGICTHDLRLIGWPDLLLVNDIVSLWIKMSLVTHKNYYIYMTRLSRTSWHPKFSGGQVVSHGLLSGC
jgi:hypothetical protein